MWDTLKCTNACKIGVDKELGTKVSERTFKEVMANCLTNLNGTNFLYIQ